MVFFRSFRFFVDESVAALSPPRRLRRSGARAAAARLSALNDAARRVVSAASRLAFCRSRSTSRSFFSTAASAARRLRGLVHADALGDGSLLGGESQFPGKRERRIDRETRSSRSALFDDAVSSANGAFVASASVFGASPETLRSTTSRAGVVASISLLSVSDRADGAFEASASGGAPGFDDARVSETREGVFVGLRVSILRVADAAPGSLEAVEGVETAACAVLRRRISAATPGEVSSEEGGNHQRLWP